MCDRRTFIDELIKRLSADGYSKQDIDLALTNHSPIIRYYDSFSSAVGLLRTGDFATMDELSNLAVGSQHAKEILPLKKLMRFVMALNNPEDLWAKSDYRRFIQEIFTPSSSSLRDDVVVLSFNYDPYFDRRLLGVVRARTVVKPVRPEQVHQMSQAATSGFLYPTNLAWLSAPGFCHLKLHGASVFVSKSQGERISWPPQNDESTDLTTDRLFLFPTAPRLHCLASSDFSKQDPPCLLPWEIISDDGKLRGESEFDSILDKEWQHRSLYPLFSGIWERARREVQEADKISFVGLSIGPFMEPEFKFLFTGKEGIIQAVYANPENQRFKDYEDKFHPRTCRGRLLDLLSTICPKLLCNRSDSEGGMQPESRHVSIVTRRDASEVTARHDFADFIQNEL